MLERSTYHSIEPTAFWGEIAPCDHVVQLYSEESAFLDSLADFVAGGIGLNEGVIVIATLVHRLALEKLLRDRGIDVDDACERGQYISVGAIETLSKFLVDGSPDENQFRLVVSELLERAGHRGRRVRAFGEMVAVLWATGQAAATVRLEHLWSKACQEEAFSLFCAYPKSGFTHDAAESIEEICAAHSKMW